MYKVACAWKAFAGHNSAEYKWNFDCTTVTVSAENTNNIRCVIKTPGSKEKVDATNVNESLDVLIKIPTLGSACGEIGRLVTLVAVPDMPENQFFKCRVAGLVNHCSSDRDGLLYLCKSKAGCAALWRDMFLEFIIPTIDSSAMHHQHKYEDGSPMEPFLHSDGETVIMKEAFDQSVMEKFWDSLINYLKGGPSHTSKTQDLDCGFLFSSLKAGLKAIANKNEIVLNTTLRRNMGEALDSFHQAFPDVAMSPLMREKIIYGAICIVKVTQKHWTASKMIDSSNRQRPSTMT